MKRGVSFCTFTWSRIISPQAQRTRHGCPGGLRDRRAREIETFERRRRRKRTTREPHIKKTPCTLIERASHTQARHIEYKLSTRQVLDARRQSYATLRRRVAGSAFTCTLLLWTVVPRAPGSILFPARQQLAGDATTTQCKRCGTECAVALFASERPAYKVIRASSCSHTIHVQPGSNEKVLTIPFFSRHVGVLRCEITRRLKGVCIRKRNWSSVPFRRQRRHLASSETARWCWARSHVQGSIIATSSGEILIGCDHSTYDRSRLFQTERRVRRRQ